MTDLRKAAEMALYALEFNYPLIEDYGNKEQLDTHHEAIMALCKSLAQEQTKCLRCGEVNPAEIHTCSPQVAQKPVAWKDKAYGNLHHQNFGNSIPLYTAPPKREWVELTDAELAEFSAMKLGAYDLCLEVEAKLMEKNGGSI